MTHRHRTARSRTRTNQAPLEAIRTMWIQARCWPRMLQRIPSHRRPFVVDQASVAFNFPGQKIGPATLEYRHSSRPSGGDMIGPAICEFSCCAGDREAFEAWVESTKPSLAPGSDGEMAAA